MSDSCSLLGFPVHGVPQGRILECVAISFTRGSSRPRNWTQVSYITGRFFTDLATWETQYYVDTAVILKAVLICTGKTES